MIIILQDFKLPSWNEIYSSPSWHKRKKIADEVHEVVYWNIKKYFDARTLPLDTPVKILYEVDYKFNRRHDPDNACVKLITDGLVYADVLEDDSTKEISEITVRVRTKQKHDRTKITITKS